MVSPKKYFIFGEINHFPGQSVFLKINENGPVNCFSQDFWFLCFRSPQKNFFFAVPRRGSFGRILTMQLEPPKGERVAHCTAQDKPKRFKQPYFSATTTLTPARTFFSYL